MGRDACGSAASTVASTVRGRAAPTAGRPRQRHGQRAQRQSALLAGRRGQQRESSRRSREPPVAAARTLISKTRIRILGRWLRRVMSCRVADRGHRRSWSWPGTAPRTCCAGSSTSGTDPGTPGCPGSSPPGIRSGTATAWSAFALVRCGPLENPGTYVRVPRRVLGRDGQIRPWTPAAPSTPGIHDPGTSPGHDDGPEAALDARRPSSGVPERTVCR